MKRKSTTLAAVLFAAVSTIAVAGQHSQRLGGAPKVTENRVESFCECGAKLDGSKQHSHQASVGMQVKGIKVTQVDGDAAPAMAGAMNGKTALTLSNGRSSFPKVGYIRSVK